MLGALRFLDPEVKAVGPVIGAKLTRLADGAKVVRVDDADGALVLGELVEPWREALFAVVVDVPLGLPLDAVPL